MATATLAAIQQKVRRLTRSPSTAILSDSDLNQYINTFLQYDFPQHLRVYNLRSTFTFYTAPNVDTYDTQTTDSNNALYNFKNTVQAVHPTAYIAGIPAFFTQYRDIFYGYYPQYNSINNEVATADGTVGPFTGTLSSTPILPGSVIFSTLAANNVPMTLIDWPQSNSGTANGAEGFIGYQNTEPNVLTALGAINYLTGEFTVEFPQLTVSGSPIRVTTIPYQAGKPICILYYDQKFVLRPVPDKAYAVQLEVDIRPTELINTTDVPQIEQWWQYIAYGAAKKIFEDRSDLDSVKLIMPEFKQQELLVQRDTLTVQANERTVTIYTVGKQTYGPGFWGAGWPY